MCLLSMSIKKYKRKRNWVEGYKILRWTSFAPAWRSEYSKQKWEFAELVKAVNPSHVKFRGKPTHYYETGIHAWKSPHFIHAPLSPSMRTVKVLLFGVTHYDKEAYRADAAIIIEALDRDGNREAW